MGFRALSRNFRNISLHRCTYSAISGSSLERGFLFLQLNGKSILQHSEEKRLDRLERKEMFEEVGEFFFNTVNAESRESCVFVVLWYI